MTEPTWTSDFALAQQRAKNAHADIEDLMRKTQLLEVGRYVQETFQRLPIGTVCDIGGGSRGGALFFFRKGKRSILVDILAKDYIKMGQLPAHVEAMESDFGHINIDSESVDIVFAWDVFDHAKDKNHFLQGMKEAERILKLGGLLFLTLPLRYVPREGHPICLTVKDAREALTHYRVLKESAMGYPMYYDFIYLFAGQKLVNTTDGFMIWTDQWPDRLSRHGLFYTGGDITKSLHWSPHAWQCQHFKSEYEAGQIAQLLRNTGIECYVTALEKIKEFA